MLGNSFSKDTNSKLVLYSFHYDFDCLSKYTIGNIYI